MTAKIIDGKQIAADLRASTKDLVSEFVDRYNNPPTLAVVLVGEDPASQVYVKTKTKMAKEIGMNVEDHFFEKTVSETELLNLINQLNTSKDVNGILVQLPLPDHWRRSLNSSSIPANVLRQRVLHHADVVLLAG